MRLFVRSSRAALGGAVALVAAVVAALAVLVPALTLAAVDSDARNLIATSVGAAVGVDLALPVADDPAAQDAAVRETVAQTFPAAAAVRVARTATSGLVDVAAGRGYLATRDDDAGAPPGVEGTWPSSPDEAALPVAAAEALGVRLDDTVDLAGIPVRVTALWAPSDEAADRWFGVRAEFADSGGAGPMLVDARTLAAVTSAASTPVRVHWTLRPSPAGLATLQDATRAWNDLPRALRAAGVDVSDADRTGRLVPTVQTAIARAAVVEAAEPVALSTAVVTSLAVTAMFAALLVRGRAPERRLRWARGQPAARIVALEAAGVLLPGVVGAVVGVGAVAMSVPFPPSLRVWAAGVVGVGSLVPAVAVAGFAAIDLRGRERTTAAPERARRWILGVLAASFALAAGVSAARLVVLGSTLGPARDGTAPDPIAVLAPAAVLLAVVLAATALPLLLSRRAWERRARRGGALRLLSSAGAARRPAIVGAIVVLVASAVGQIAFAALYQSGWEGGYRTGLAVQEGTAYRLAADADDLTADVLADAAAQPGVRGIAPVDTTNTSISARSVSVVSAASDALTALGDPAIPELDRLASAIRVDGPGPLVPADATDLEVDVEAAGATARASAVVLLDGWGRVSVVAPGPDAVPTGTGPWRIAAVEVSVTAASPLGAAVGVTRVRAGSEDIDLGTLVLPVDVGTDALALQSEPGPPQVGVSDDVTRIRFVPVGAASPPVVVSRAFADAAGIEEGDRLPLVLDAVSPPTSTRVAAVVPAIPGAPLASAVLIDRAAVVPALLTTSPTLPQTDTAWLAVDDGVSVDDPRFDAVRAVVPDGVTLAGAAADDGAAVLSTAVSVLWTGAGGSAALSAVGIVAVGAVARRTRRGEAASLRAAGIGARARRRLRLAEACAGVGAGVVVGATAAAVAGLTILGPVVAGALPRPNLGGLVVDPLLTVSAVLVFAVLALALAAAGAVVEERPGRGSER